MKLADWLEANRYKRSVFAQMVGMTPGRITQLCDGSGWPSRDAAERISKTTDGAVTANDFMRLEEDFQPTS